MKKILVSWLVLLALLTACIAPAFAITTMYVKTGNGGPLLVRVGPGKQYKVISRLSYGSSVAVEGYEGKWAQIVWGGAYGSAYVSSEFLSATKPGSSSHTSTSDSYGSFTKKMYRAIVVPSRSSGYVNLRWAPNTKSSRMGIRFYGDELLVLAESRNWCQVLDETTYECGFMQKRFLQEAAVTTEAVTITEPTPTPEVTSSPAPAATAGSQG